MAITIELVKQTGHAYRRASGYVQTLREGKKKIYQTNIKKREIRRKKKKRL
jgi:hypothetical protein